ncbi:sensor histidine kinase [Thiosocius teredinicola]|uniref:sensor histidine kinase n=1 Tax=Thiosocius teredinicola TaxID=1973002 RepID=UPI0009914878
MRERERWQRYLLQAAFIFFTVLLSVAGVTWILQQILVKQALALEAQSFIDARLQDPTFPLPRTRNLIGYLGTAGGGDTVPGELVGLAPGLHDSVLLSGREKPTPVYIEDYAQGRLYLVFAGYNVDKLVGMFGLVPIGLLLVIVYGASWVAYRVSDRAVSPILRIARRLEESSPEQGRPKIPLQELKGETKELAIALDDYARRMDAMVERERQFSSDVSHELRTPITIIDGAAQFLAAEQCLSDKGRQRAEMIRRACRDVSELIDAFLILGREPTLLDRSDAVDAAEVSEVEMAKLSPLLDQERVGLEVDVEQPLWVPVNRKVLEIIVSNLCRNAIKHTDAGSIRIIIRGDSLSVEDTGIGIDDDLIPHIFDRHVKGRGAQRAGEGIGLNIVKRLCDMYGWQINVRNNPGPGVTVSIKMA